MTVSRDLLLEIGTEELPPKELNKLSEALARNLQQGLAKAALTHADTEIFATPRRLAVYIKALVSAQKTHVVEKRGPALTAAFDSSGHPTLACLGFANSCGVTVEELTTQETEKGAWLFFRREQPGKTTIELLPEIVRQAIAALPINKPMHWGKHKESFIRPVHWIVLLFGKDLVAADILGLKTRSSTFGHRFLHPQKIPIPHPSDYEGLLETPGFVIADFHKRQNLVREQVLAIAAKKGQAHIDEALLAEVTAIVEWPCALLGEFTESFLEIPPEVIITAMQSHQKYFPVLDAHERLLPYFVTICNIASKQPERVVMGNQRVLHARLADAGFFYHSDLKHPLEHHLEGLNKVIFQKKLGSLFEKAQRISSLASLLAKGSKTSDKHAKRAGLLAKADLTSAMVGEFPELQGIMGSYYAEQDGEAEEVIAAIREHYQPRFSGDTLPETLLGCQIALADKIDTLVGLFGVGQPPSGEKDPFGLRRCALGILRILIEKQLPLDLLTLLTQATTLYGNKINNSKIVRETFDFMIERLRAWYLDREVTSEVFNAVLARLPTQPMDFHARIQAVQDFQKLPEAQALTVANKRVGHILKNQSGEWRHHPINPDLFEQKAEKQLLAAIEQINKKIEILYRDGKYSAVLSALASLRTPIDSFFDEVMVMVDDEKLRNNRLAMLYQLQQLFIQVADISLL